ncbi:MAG: zf-HC2 domain-containing protein [Bryobacteraceae bacterium]
MQKLISAHLDHQLPDEEGVRVEQHLASCRECAARSREFAQLRSGLRSMAYARPPAELISRLQVVASRERARRLERLEAGSALRRVLAQFSLLMDNLMRPLALPFAGGLVSALCIFGMLLPTLWLRIGNAGGDVPTAFYTQPSLEDLGPVDFLSDETVIEVTVDERGRITDYTVPSGKLARDLESQMANLVLFSSFQPATLFGRPTSGKVLVSFRRSRIVVRG